MHATPAQFEQARERYTVFAIHAAARLARDVGFSYEPVNFAYLPVGDAPDTAERVQREYAECSRTHRGFRVDTQHCEDIIFTSREGNYAFRFWHDVVSHGAGKLAFTTADELKAGMQWVHRVADHFGARSIEAAMAYADTCGQTLYCEGHNAFPENQLEFVREYVTHCDVADIQPFELND